ncbi:hypothetical protein GGR50DRAFT_36462 [Xylaria sp. CBS 124048]|nr:hypothetical protein GGR50DRAFT_36462 [Xylaria sp. CBS 124048]
MFFQVGAPRIKKTISKSANIKELLEDGEFTARLVRLLVVPSRTGRYRLPRYWPRRYWCPSPSPPAPCPSDDRTTADAVITFAETTPSPNQKGTKRSRDEEFSRHYKRIKTSRQNGAEVVPHVATNLLSLPAELHWHIFSYIPSIRDAIAFGLTSRYFLSVCRKSVIDHYVSFIGKWAGANVVSIGNAVAPNDYPPGLFSAEELETLRHQKYDPPFPPTGRRLVEARPFSLQHFRYPSISELEDLSIAGVDQLSLKLYMDCSLDGISNKDLMHASPAIFDTDDWIPKDETWILRNLTTKQIVRPEAIALSPDYIDGPDIKGLGFGEVIVSRTCWATLPDLIMDDLASVWRGVWAGHRFDIVTLARHQDTTDEAEWGDASEEVVEYIDRIWTIIYGRNWREVIHTSVREGARSRL